MCVIECIVCLKKSGIVFKTLIIFFIVLILNVKINDSYVHMKGTQYRPSNRIVK